MSEIMEEKCIDCEEYAKAQKEQGEMEDGGYVVLITYCFCEDVKHPCKKFKRNKDC